MKQIFDMRRFWNTLKWTVLTERKGLTTIVAGFFVAFLAVQLFSCFTISDLSAGLGSGAALGGQVSCFAVLAFMQVYYASGVLGHARESRQRTTVLMLPASHAEKFVSRLLFCLVIIPLLLYVTLISATGMRMLIEWLAGHDGIATGMNAFSNSGQEEVEFWAVTQWLSTLWGLSFFVLGGVLFRYRPFVWTCVSLVAGSLLFFTVVFYGVRIIGVATSAILVRDLFGGMTFDGVQILLNILFAVFAALHLWISYRLFARLQVVQHKWFNI